VLGGARPSAGDTRRHDGQRHPISIGESVSFSASRIWAAPIRIHHYSPGGQGRALGHAQSVQDDSRGHRIVQTAIAADIGATHSLNFASARHTQWEGKLLVLPDRIELSTSSLTREKSSNRLEKHDPNQMLVTIARGSVQSGSSQINNLSGCVLVTLDRERTGRTLQPHRWPLMRCKGVGRGKARRRPRWTLRVHAADSLSRAALRW
jgi:hypothetical protein